MAKVLIFNRSYKNKAKFIQLFKLATLAILKIMLNSFFAITGSNAGLVIDHRAQKKN